MARADDESPREAGMKRHGGQLRVQDAMTRSVIVVGIVSRADLLSAFMRSDEEVAAEVRSIVHRVLATDLREIRIQPRGEDTGPQVDV